MTLKKDWLQDLTAREGRRFGFTLGTAFLALAVLFWWCGHETLFPIAIGLAAALLLAGALTPGRLGPVYRVWMRLAEVISRVTTPIVMTLLYYLILTPSGILRRTFGAHPLKRELNDGGFWVRRTDAGARTDMHRQF